MSGIIVGLDIGSSFIRVAIGELDLDNNIKIIGAAKAPSKGVNNGVIINSSAVEACVKEALDSAEQMAGVDVSHVYVSIGGSQVSTLNSSGQVGIDPSSSPNRKNRITNVGEDAKKRAIKAAEAINIPWEKQFIHTIPREWIVDGISYKNGHIKDLIGTEGVRLEVKVHIVMATITALKKIDDTIMHLGYQRSGRTLKTLAAAVATLPREDMELGSILIDLGGGTTDVMVIYDSAPVYTVSLPVGGWYVTNDIAQVKGIPFDVAEDIKIKYGCCWIDESEEDETVTIPGVGSRPPEETSRFELCQIIQSRMDEIFSMIKDSVKKHSGLTSLNGSIVLTGGGALMYGIVELAQSAWHTTAVRKGEAPNLGELDCGPLGKNVYRQPDFATAVGLVLANKNGAVVEKQKPAKKGSSKHEEKKDVLGGLKSGAKSFWKKIF
ncbi:MAG: cell division protein FtsA [Treponema sp.]|nr:cell division protein FtsA [Treponema sp.]